jgi:hypothetical protein
MIYYVFFVKSTHGKGAYPTLTLEEEEANQRKTLSLTTLSTCLPPSSRSQKQSRLGKKRKERKEKKKKKKKKEQMGKHLP